MTNREQRGNFDLDRVTGSLASRRTVARGLAWTVPVVSVAAAAPAFATSCQTFQFNDTISYKCPGNSTADEKGYYLSICFKCPPGQTPPPGTSASSVTIVAVETNQPLIVTPIQPGCNKLPQALLLDQCTTPIHFNSTNSSTPLQIRYFFTGDPLKKTFVVDIKAPPEAASCTTPVYCCTDLTKPFPERHECPPATP